MMYEIGRDGFFAIPTAEVPVTNFHRSEILSHDELPLYYVAYTPCWRREARSYGKDVRGVNRLNQFDKVEIVKIVTTEEAMNEPDTLRIKAEEMLNKLKLHYRILKMYNVDLKFTQ